MIELEQLLRQGAFAQVLDCYRGDLLPGFLDEWIEDERNRLSALQARAYARGSGAAEKAPSREPPPARPETAPPKAAERGSGFRTLPSYVSVFFGRESDKRCVLDALAQYRLLTLSGSGGCGKTRLAVESARAAESFDRVLRRRPEDNDSRE